MYCQLTCTKSSSENNDNEGEEFHLCRLFHEMKITSFTQAAVSVWCCGRSPCSWRPVIILKWRCPMSAEAVMKFRPIVSFYIYIVNLSAKTVSIPGEFGSCIGIQRCPTRHTCPGWWTRHTGRSKISEHDTCEPRVGRNEMCNVISSTGMETPMLLRAKKPTML